VRLRTDNAGAQIDKLSYDGFGKLASETNPTNGDSYKYAGYRNDSMTNLDEAKARWYNPATGTWLDRDPIGFAGGPNPYEYVGNGPTNGTDPSGLEPTQAELDRRKEWSRKWLDKANQLKAGRENSVVTQFFGGAPYDPPTERELLLQRNAARVLDTENWIVDDYGGLHSMAQIATESLLKKMGMARPRDNGPSIRSVTPEAAREGLQQREQRQKDLESQEAYSAFFERSMVQVNPEYKAEWDKIERVRQREAAERARRLEALSPDERGILFVLETLIWEIAGAGLGNHEWAFYGWRQGAAHQFFGPDNATDVWSIKKVNPQSMIHLTEKPTALASRAMEYSSKPGENVLDLFGGSGSTLIAAEQMGRRAFLMELDALYTDVTVNRWEQFTGKKAKRAGVI
jgi:RHS repeat-associated protein